MPNWCSNDVLIEGDAEQLLDLAKVAGLLTKKGKLKRKPEFNFSAVYPCDDQKVLEAEAEFQKTNDQEHRISTELFDWNRSHWGTKWSVGDNVFNVSLEEGALRLAFDTAWSPPEGVFEYIVHRWPKLMVYVKYEEPGNDLSGCETYYGDEVTAA